MTLCIAKRLAIGLAAAFLFGTSSQFVFAADNDELQREFEELRRQNQKLQEQVQRQEKTIQSLEEKVSNLAADKERASSGAVSEPETESASGKKVGFFGDRIRLSGEAGLGIFDGSSDGEFPNTEFRVDEARLFLDAKVIDDVYFFTELNLTTRESYDDPIEIGELYVDFENLSQYFGREYWMSLRVGRFDIPFGEEYLTRDAIDNPLILHSLADFWGIDEGAEIYGGIGKFSYVLAVQNGGKPLLRDYTGDKAVIGRISYDPKNWLHLSVSGMRTGDLSVSGDETSELWFGNGFVRNISAGATRFHAEIFQGDVQFHSPRRHLNLSGGMLQADDNAPGMDDFRRNYFYSVEAFQKLTDKFFGAARFSQIFADDGMPIVGNGMFGRYFYNLGNQTEMLWRLSVGVGYRVNRHLLLKTEYSYEQGHLTGDRRRNANFVGAEAAVGF